MSSLTKSAAIGNFRQKGVDSLLGATVWPSPPTSRSRRAADAAEISLVSCNRYVLWSDPGIDPGVQPRGHSKWRLFQ
jgi:hypothetical protein